MAAEAATGQSVVAAVWCGGSWGVGLQASIDYKSRH